jgi:hypothetical protein
MDAETGVWVTTEDMKKMTAALSAFKGYEWWFKTENPEPDRRCLAPLVLQNMKIGYEAGTLEPTMNQFQNLLHTAIYYQQKCRRLMEDNPKVLVEHLQSIMEWEKEFGTGSDTAGARMLFAIILDIGNTLREMDRKVSGPTN